MASRLAFFDVDETVIRVKSMFEFLRFWLSTQGDHDGTRYEAVAGELHARAASGVHRTEINRAYYRQFAGAEVADVVDAARRWYAGYRREPDAFITATLDALARHRDDGDTVVLVSGSFEPVLAPLAADVGAGAVLCTEPIVGTDGRYTGDVVRPMIGTNKADAVAELVAARGAQAEDCACYADHSSDLDMLQVVGRPTVVGDDPALRAHAADHGWAVLPADPGPLPAAIEAA